jgi:hypothetical protein
MSTQKLETLASIVVLAIVVIVVLIAVIVESADSGLQFLSACGLMSLLGLIRHSYNLGRLSS